MSFTIGLNTLIVIHVVLVPAFECTTCLKVLAFSAWLIQSALARLERVQFLSLRGVYQEKEYKVDSRHMVPYKTSSALCNARLQLARS